MEDDDFLMGPPANPDDRSVGRLRRLTSHDPNDVIRAISVVTAKPSKGRFSFDISPLPLTSVILFCLIYLTPIFPEFPTAHTCLAILLLGGYLWATDIIPSYITAYLVPFLCVWFAIGLDSDTGDRMSSSDLAIDIAAKFMDPIIFVFLGSLTMSSALCKLEITDRVSSLALRKISPRPHIILFTIMVLNFATAAFLSNIASTTLLLTFSLPIVRSLDPADPFIKALLLGLAWSGNAGGMVTTIASVQNILAIKYINDSGALSISFIAWTAFAGPTAVVCLLYDYFYVRFRFRTTLKTIHVNAANRFSEWTWKHTFTVGVTFVTIVLMAMQESFSQFFGHVGITALIPIVALFSVKVLDAEDFGRLRWSTLSLMGGGLALGEAMRVSQLLSLLSDAIEKVLGGLDIWTVTLIFLVIEAVLVSVINHTSAAAILFPVLNEIGSTLFNDPTVFLTLSALMIGNAQLFHISSFPTALVSGVQRHAKGEPTTLLPEPFVSGPEFFTLGWPVVLGSVLIIASVGYGLVVGLGLAPN